MSVPEQQSSAPMVPRPAYVPFLRIASGLILFAFALTHFVNHAFGLVSLDLMQSGQDIRTFFTRSVLGTTVLVSAATVHFVLGISKFLNVRTWRLGFRNGIQLCFGLLIPIFLIRHVIGTRGVNEMFGIDDSYTYALWAMWPGEDLRQAILMMLVWVHSCIGLHHWLNSRLWYRQTQWIWYGLAVVIPALSYAGFATTARIEDVRVFFDNPFTSEQYARVLEVFSTYSLAYLVILAGAVGVWLILLFADRFARKISVTYADGPVVRSPKGLSVLAISRINRIPHASVCGGRARCSTCRIRVIDGLDHLPPVSATELKVLKRIGAPPNVRLACQLQPTADLTISTLLPANADAAQGAQADRYHWGIEQDVTVMFCDLRGFTRMSEGRLSFDVVFLLNQFLGRMAEAIEDSGGYVDKFMGDGIMAIFGMDAPVEKGAVQALAAARAMGGVLASLNQSLNEDLPNPLLAGIGIHTGPAILGRIGAGHRTEAAARVTALGETVNMASRLEGMTKELAVQVIVSADTIKASGLVPDGMLEERAVNVRGLRQPVIIYTALRAIDLPESI
ncbi:MAG: adenylate/guanylate cyclase domain-containing protein [Albidovulum sp.]